jgi:predicted phage-related endonuclease
MSLTPEQLALRQQGITGSEIATVAGLGKGSLWDIWAAKMGAAVEIPDNDAMREGRHYEAALVEWVRLYHPMMQREGMQIWYAGDRQQTVRSRQHTIVIATPDGVIHDIESDGCVPVACVEAKKPSRHTWHEWSEDTYPERYLCQATWEAAALEVPETILVAHVVDRTVMYDILFDEELFGYLLEEASRFWRDYVATRTPPPVDGSRQASEWLQRRFPKQEEGKVMEAGGDMALLMDVLHDYEMQERQLKARIAEAENVIKEAMGEAETLRSGNDCITWKRTKDSEVLDLERVKKYLNDNDLLRGFMRRRDGTRRLVKSWTRGKE